MADELLQQVVPDECVQVQADAVRFAVERQPRAGCELQVLRHQILEAVIVEVAAAAGGDLALVKLVPHIFD